MTQEFYSYIINENYEKFIENYETYKDVMFDYNYGNEILTINSLILCCITNKDIKLIEHILVNNPEQLDYTSAENNWLTSLLKYNESINVFKYFYTNHLEHIHNVFTKNYKQIKRLEGRLGYWIASEQEIDESINPLDSPEKYVMILFPFNGFFENNTNVEIFKYVIEETLFFGIESRYLNKRYGDDYLSRSCSKNPNIEVIKYLLSLKNTDYNFNLIYKDTDIVEYLLEYNKIDVIKEFFSNEFFDNYNIVEYLSGANTSLLCPLLTRYCDDMPEVLDIILDNKNVKISEIINLSNSPNRRNETICSFLVHPPTFFIGRYTHLSYVILKRCFTYMARKQSSELLKILETTDYELVIKYIKLGKYNSKHEMIKYRKITRESKQII
jgi:hypothetical protein